MDRAVAAPAKPRRLPRVRGRAGAGARRARQAAPSASTRKGPTSPRPSKSAAAAIPPSYVPQIVLLSDGNQTAGDAAARRPCAAGCPVSTVPLPARNEPEVQVSARQRAGPGPRGRAVLRRGRRRLQPRRRGRDRGLPRRAQGRRRAASRSRRARTASASARRSTSERLAEFTAPASQGFSDTLLDNNAASGLVFSCGKPRVLLVESDPKLAKHLGWALEQEGIQVDVRPPQGMPDTLADLQNYELLDPLQRAGHGAEPAADGGRPHLRAGPRRRPDHARRRPVVRPGRATTRRRSRRSCRSAATSRRRRRSRAWRWCWSSTSPARWAGRRSRWPRTPPRPRSSCSARSDKVGVIAFEGETYWVARACSPAPTRATSSTDQPHRGRRRHGHGPGDGGGLRGAAAARRPSSSTSSS